jgi:hypothetical protein
VLNKQDEFTRELTYHYPQKIKIMYKNKQPHSRLYDQNGAWSETLSCGYSVTG